MVRARPKSPTAEPADDTVALVAKALVTSGRVLPGLAVEGDGRSRSWWWPAPAASQRALVAGLVPDGSTDAQRRAASRLAEAVDGMVRDRLATEKVGLVRRRPGRPTLAEVWMRSLASADPWLPPSLDPAKVRTLAEVVGAWVRSATVVGGRVRLCLRVHEPVGADDWFVELLVQDRDEPSLVIPLADALQGESPFGTNVIEETLAALGRLARLAPELAPVLDQALPTGVEIDGDSVVRLLRDRTAWLEDAGIGVLLPSWWAHRSRLGLRGRVKRSSPAPGATEGGTGLGMDAIVAFDWEVALGEHRLTKRDLAALARAADAKQSLVRLRGHWVEIDPSRVGDLLDSVGTRAEATARELLRAGLGIDRLGVMDGVEVVGVDASALGWLSSLLDDALHASAAGHAPGSQPPATAQHRPPNPGPSRETLARRPQGTRSTPLHNR